MLLKQIAFSVRLHGELLLGYSVTLCGSSLDLWGIICASAITGWHAEFSVFTTLLISS